MRMRFDFPKAPFVDPVPRGAAPVGYLEELPAVELAAILYMRSWCEGGAAKDQISRDFRLMLGVDAAESALADFEALMRTALRGARRPLMRHGIVCRCFGGDESAFANMIAAAAAQDRDEAMLFACNLMSVPAAFEAVLLAGSLGQVFLRIAATPEPRTSAMDRPSPSSTH